MSRTFLVVGAMWLSTPAWAQSCAVDVTVPPSASCAYSVARDTSATSRQSQWCGGGSYTGGELVVAFTPPAGERVTVLAGRLSAALVDVDVAVTTGDCAASSTCVASDVANGRDHGAFTFVSTGATYYAVIDEDNGYTRVPVGLEVSCDSAGACPADAIAQPITCSTDISGETRGSASRLSYYDCGTPYGPLVQPFPEAIYAFSPQRDGPVTFRLDNLTVDHDLYVLESRCVAAACIASSTDLSTNVDTLTFTARKGVTYYIVVEAYAGPGTYDLSFDDNTGGCLEDCDDGIDNDGDRLVDCDDPDCVDDPVCARCDEDEDGSTAVACGGDDCDDTEPTTAPFAPEVADGVDQDCDGVVDEGTDWYDDDGDGVAEAGGDCDDGDSLRAPGLPETCNQLDDDCDGAVDEGTACVDDDGDGYCEAAVCSDGSLGGDCSDGDPAVNPGAAELDGNGVDDDCDGAVDDGAFDPDDDGYDEAGGDCRPDDPDTHPGAPERADGVDNDCDGTVDEGTEAYDDDGDGVSEQAGDCNDADPTVRPGAVEVADGVDQDCDGLVDEGTSLSDDDGDGFSEAGGDCDDADAAVYPGAPPGSDGVARDCDGVSASTEDADRDGFTVADGDCDDAEPWVRPDAPELCDTLDNDCDGEVDEGCTLPVAVRPGESAIPTCVCAQGRPSAWPLLIPLLASIRRRRRA